MKMILLCALAEGSPWKNLEECMPKIIQRISILLEAGDESAKILAAINNFSMSVTKKPYIFEANSTIEIDGPASCKVFLSDLKYNCLPDDESLNTFKAIVRFDPQNKKLMSLNTICNNVKCYEKEEIQKEYEDLTKEHSEEQASEFQSEKPNCIIM